MKMEMDTQEGWVTSEDIAHMRRSLGKTIEMKVKDRVVTGVWNDIELNNKTGKITGVYVDEKLYRLGPIDYFKIK